MVLVHVLFSLFQPLQSEMKNTMRTINKFLRHDVKKHTGLTLVELMIGVVIIGIIGAIATVAFQSFAEKARIKKAVSEITSIQTKIKIYETYAGDLPDSLSDLDDFNLYNDPWGNPYQYTNFDNTHKSKWRKDRNLHPLNTDYDLWSMGKDGKSKVPLTAKASHDDIIRASDGSYIGIAADY